MGFIMTDKTHSGTVHSFQNSFLSLDNGLCPFKPIVWTKSNFHTIMMEEIRGKVVGE